MQGIKTFVLYGKINLGFKIFISYSVGGIMGKFLILSVLNVFIICSTVFAGPRSDLRATAVLNSTLLKKSSVSWALPFLLHPLAIP